MSEAKEPVTMNTVMQKLDNAKLLLKDMQAFDTERVESDPDDLRRRAVKKLRAARSDIERLEEMVMNAGVHVVAGGRDLDHCPFCGWNDGASWKRHASAAHPKDFARWKEENGTD